MKKINNDNNNPRSKNKKNKKRNKFIKFFILSLFLLIILSFAMPSFKKANYTLNNGFPNGLSNNILGINMNLKPITNTPDTQEDNFAIIMDKEVFIPFNIVKTYIDKFIYLDEKEDIIIITNENEVVKLKLDENDYSLNDRILTLDTPSTIIDGKVYISKSFIEQFYGVTFELSKDTNILDIYTKNHQKGFVAKNTKLRLSTSSKSSYIENLKKGDEVHFFENEKDYDNTKFLKVRSPSGYIGYVSKSKVKDIINVDVNFTYISDYEVKPNFLADNGKINIVFDQMQNRTANSASHRTEYIDGIDVLAPTWFSFDKNVDGKIKNIASLEYVNIAHNNGYKVWAIITDNFDKEVSHNVLSSSKTRDYVITQLLEYINTYNLDGINIDFESLPVEDGNNFVQFFRELSVPLRRLNKTLSVDVFVPRPWTAHYNRENIAKVSDYMVVMAYDEHYSGSETAGSVATINWSKLAIEDCFKENVPKDKLILGVPFYSRGWVETKNDDGTISLSSRAYNMLASRKFIEDRDGSFSYLADIGQYYGEAFEDGKTYKLWLEDATSIQNRLVLVTKYDVAGVASWKRGLETQDIWNVLRENLK